MGELDEMGVQIDGLEGVDGGGGGVVGAWSDGGLMKEVVKILRLRTAINSFKLSPQSSFGESYTYRLVKRKTTWELLGHLKASDY